MIQRMAARWIINNFDYRSSVTAILQNLGWRTLEQRRVDARLWLFYKIVYGLVAVPLTDYIHSSHRIGRFIHPDVFTNIHFIHWQLSNEMPYPSMLYVYHSLIRSRMQLVDCSTPGLRSQYCCL